MSHEEAKRPSNIVTEQIVIETKYNTRLIPVTAEKDSIDEINKALETAKKEHELLGLYRKHYELSKNPRNNKNHNEVRPYIEWANEINKLEGLIIELEVEITEWELELK